MIESLLKFQGLAKNGKFTCKYLGVVMVRDWEV